MALPETLVNGTTADADQVMSNFNYLDGKFTDWQTWTPSWTNVTVGNGTVVARYTKINKTVVAFARITLGSTSSVGSIVSVSLPVTATSSEDQLIGECVSIDKGTATYAGNLIISSETTALIRVFNVAGTYSTLADITASVPFTWVTGDVLSLYMTYEAA